MKRDASGIRIHTRNHTGIRDRRSPITRMNAITRGRDESHMAQEGGARGVTTAVRGLHHHGAMVIDGWEIRREVKEMRVPVGALVTCGMTIEMAIAMGIRGMNSGLPSPDHIPPMVTTAAT